MIKNYIKIALRNFARHKLYAGINIFGLAVGLALCLTIIGHIVYELSIDDFHQNKENIYRVNGIYTSEQDEVRSARVMAPLGRVLKDEISDVKKSAVFRIEGLNYIEIEDEAFRVEDKNANHAFAHPKVIIFANSDYLEVFTFPLVQGNPATAVSEPFSILISEDAAVKYFQGSNPVGKVMKLNDRIEGQITGIIHNIPQNTQLYTDFIVSYSTLERLGENLNSWDSFDTDYLYVLLNDHSIPSVVAEKIAVVLGNNLKPESAKKYRFELIALKDIYFSSLGSGFNGELSPMGEVSVIYVFAIIALFILIQAGANFINLSTARSADRMREVGIRKVFGAQKKQLIKQFLGESILIALIAMIIGLSVYEFIKLKLNVILPREMLADFYSDPMMLASSVTLIIAVGIFAGFYPALYLSRFNPVKIMQGKTSIKSSKSKLRRALVIFQYTLAIVFIICTTIIYRQINYIMSINLGFDKENVLVLDFEGEDASEKCQLVKSEILSKNRVISATASNCPPGRKTYTFYGFYTDDSRSEESRVVGNMFYADYDFLSTFGLQIVQGRDFSKGEVSDAGNAIVITETTVKSLGIENPIGYKIYRKNSFLEVVGVVKDYHGTALDWAYQEISVIALNPEKCKSLSVKLPPDDISGSVEAIRDIWRSALPSEEFKYIFLDNELYDNYADVRGQGMMFLILACLTITIALLGIFGLVSYTSEQRTKEIGIRKVLGSTISEIVLLLSKEFLILIGIALAIASPLAYFMSMSMLQEYPFRVPIGIGTFLVTGLITIVLTFATSGYQSIKAASADPIKSLRYE